MKKTIITSLVLLLVISISACGKRAGDRVEDDAQGNAQDNAQHQPEQTVDATQSEELITKDKAIEIALNKAGLTKDEIYDLESDLDREIQGVIWEVDFETKEYDYSYDIDAKTGEIVLEEVEPERDANKPVQQTKEPQSEETIVQPEKETVTQPTVAPNKENEEIKDNKAEQKDEEKVEEKNEEKAEQNAEQKDEQKVETELIDRDKAISIALKKAGVTRDKVYELEAELDKERQGVIWEVDFETKEYDYSYDIDAKTGKIVLEEVEPEKEANKPAQQTKKPQSEETTEKVELISRNEAIDVALKKAGLTRDKVYELEAELDKERQVIVWEVDFETREYEYSYEINAQTGDIVDQQKERND